MLLEESALHFYRCREAPAGEARHDLAQRRRMILRFEIVLDPLDAERGEIVAQARQRTLIEKTGQIVGPVGQQLATPEADEQVEIFAFDFGWGFRRSFGQRGMGAAKRRGVAVELRYLAEQCARGRTRKQCGKQSVFA